MPRNEGVQSHRSAGGAAQLVRRTVGLHIEAGLELRHTPRNVFVRHLARERTQFVHFDNLNMRAKDDGNQREVGHDVQHAAVVVAHQPQPRRGQSSPHPRCRQPLLDLPPGRGLVEHARHLMKRNACPLEYVGNLRHRAGRAVGQPLAGHRGAILQPVERRVINGRLGLKIQHHHGHAGALHQRQHGVGEGIRGDVEKQHVDVFAAAAAAGVARALGSVHQAQVHHLHAGPLEPLRDLCHIALKPLLEPGKLAPVGVQSDAAQAHAHWPLHAHLLSMLIRPVLKEDRKPLPSWGSARRDASLHGAQKTEPWPAASAD